jgi:hypothetical protein
MRTTLTGSSLAVVSLITSSLVLAGGCSEKQVTPPAPSASAPAPSASAPASAPAASANDPRHDRAERGADEIRPVYPMDAPIVPEAKRFCEAIYTVQEKRKAECCSGVPSPAAAGVAELCAKTLSYAIGSKAITLAAGDVDACTEALGKQTTGCDWMNPYSVDLPPACEGILKGTLAKDAPCRSSLECADGMRCQGLSAVDMGKCGPPKPVRYPCNLAIDTLASHTRQSSVNRAHPECEGYCTRGYCSEPLAEGTACVTDMQCGRGRCEGSKCTNAPLPAPGEACTGSCAPGARCAKGKCVAPKAEGEACEVNEECRAMCVRGDGGAAGKCEKMCTAPTPKIVLPKPPKR